MTRVGSQRHSTKKNPNITHQCYSRRWKYCPPDQMYSVQLQKTLFTHCTYSAEIVEISRRTL